MKRSEPKRLREGKAFHRKIQQEWLDEAEGQIELEKGIKKTTGQRGRIDIMVDAQEETKALIEIKASDWDAMSDQSVRRHVRRQIKQIWDYIESQPDDANGVCPGVIFPKRPTDPTRRKWIEDAFIEEGIPVVWHDETIEECREWNKQR